MSEKFCLRWNDFENNISVAFREIREEKDFFDCTLSVGDRQLQAHKLILSACSPFFRSILKKNPHPHPLLYLKGVEFSDLQSVLNFMYHGEVNVAQEELNSFLAVAENLKVKGLTQNSSSEDISSPKASNIPLDIKPRSISTPRNVPTDPPVLKRPKPTPQFITQHDDDDDIQEVMPVVKTEPVVEQQQLPMNTLQQSQPEVQTTSYTSGTEGQVVGGVLTQMEDETVYGEDDGYDYGGYEEGYEGIEEASTGEVNRGTLDQMISHHGSAQYSCNVCGLEFKKRCNAKTHIEARHLTSEGISCDLCGFVSKTKDSLRKHKIKHRSME